MSAFPAPGRVAGARPRGGAVERIVLAASLAGLRWARRRRAASVVVVQRRAAAEAAWRAAERRDHQFASRHPLPRY